jgi:transposase
MPKHLTARPPLDAVEERQVRRLAHSVHAPADWIVHAKLVVRSWDGLPTGQIAEELSCHPQTVRDHLHAFNDRGLDGLGMQPGSGRKSRLTEPERSAILALVKLPPPGKPTYELMGELAAPGAEGEPEWTLDTLTPPLTTRSVQARRKEYLL